MATDDSRNNPKSDANTMNRTEKEAYHKQYSKHVFFLILYYLALLFFSFWLLIDVWSATFNHLRFFGLPEKIFESPALRTIGFTIIAGIFGSILYQIRALFRHYCKTYTYHPRWIGKYVTAPWEGAALALIVLALIRGGLSPFGGASAEITPATNFASFGTGALVGFGMRDVVGWLGDLIQKLFKTSSSDNQKSENAEKTESN